ncbi:hypothetical protein Zmor_022540 [Zophobas morio]|uniref:Uncharacterized protein n=1 Tax=Zophobas morio TaxID=2755281 RepID=A0AA38HVT4_9CUCU|nr:hypothetical protein Zmor_022540 [Zophobas morio]
MFVVSTNSSDYVGPTIILGTLGVATVPNNEAIEIYLNDGTIPVPKWVWLLWDKREQIFFYYNGPFPEEGKDEITKLCSSYHCLVSYLCICHLEWVIDTEMRQLIDNNFN